MCATYYSMLPPCGPGLCRIGRECTHARHRGPKAVRVVMASGQAVTYSPHPSKRDLKGSIGPLSLIWSGGVVSTCSARRLLAHGPYDRHTMV